MKKNSAQTAAAATKEAEEAFLTLLQRIQRQAQTMVVAIASKRPPEEAAAAMGRQLALRFQALSTLPPQPHQPAQESTAPQTLLPYVAKGIQEKTLHCLVHRTINPATITSFLQTLLPANSPPLVQMDWLPSWILHAESIVLQDAEDPSFHALSSMIRAFGQYQLWWQQQQLHHQWMVQVRRGISTTAITTVSNKKLSSSSLSTLDSTSIATVYRRLQSAPARTMMIREMIQIAFASSASAPSHKSIGTGTDGLSASHSHGSGDDGGSLGTSVGSSTTGNTGSHTQRRRPNAGSPRQVMQEMISPLLAACVLTLETPTTESMLFMETLWRECWAEVTTWFHREEETRDAQQDFLDTLQWLTRALNIYLWGIPCHAAKGNTKGNWLEHMVASKELAMRWLSQLLELASFLVQTFPDENQSQDPNYSMYLTLDDGAIPGALAEWLSRIASETIPRLFAIMPSYQISFEGCLIHMLQILQRLSNQNYYPIQNDQQPQHQPQMDDKHNIPKSFEFLDTVATLRLAAVVLSNPVPADVQLLLQILHVALSTSSSKPSKGTHTSTTSTAILRGLASMLMRKDGCQTTCQQMIQILSSPTEGTLSLSQNSKRHIPLHTSNKKATATRLIPNMMENVIQFLDPSLVDVENFLAFLSTDNCVAGTQFTAMQQTGSLLLGVGLLMNDSKHQISGYKFLGHLLDVYPHLGISLLPVIVDCINAACVKGDADTLQRHLDFLCDSVIKDTQCAREIWNLLGVQLMQTATTPSVIRASVIRLFPKICLANKRLYKRVIETIGNQLVGSSHNVAIRLAAAATIADLAKQDRIRDVTDVIAWIQGFITEISWIRPVSTLDEEKSASNAALVYYAVLALHYLLVSQELDFNLVIVVLNKRLCRIHDMNEVSLLPPLVLESLILLLGDGECDDDNDEDEQPDKLRTTTISPQVSRSVETLIDLALSPKLNIKKGKQDVLLQGTLLRCRRNIFLTLSQYSLDALGIDDVGLQAIAAASDAEEPPELPPTGLRYEALKQVVDDGIHLLISGPHKMEVTPPSRKGTVATPDEIADSDVTPALVSLISKLLKFEEDVLGSSLWQKRGSRKGQSSARNKNPGKTAAETSQSQVLPTASEVHKTYTDKRCSASSLAALLCFEGKPLSFLGDLAADVTHESADPYIGAFTAQAWLNAARSTLMELVVSFSSSEGLENVLLEVREWRFRLDSADNMYLALSSLALLIPEILGPFGDHSQYVDEICEEVWNGYGDGEFENEDIGKLCLGFIGVCALRSGSDDLLNDIVDALERSISGYGGRASFGAFYGLAIIAQTSQHCFDEAVDNEDRAHFMIGLISRIMGFLVNELVLCLTSNSSALGGLINSIQTGEITPEIIDTVTAFGKKPMKIIPGKTDAAKALFISLALCLPALSAVNDDLLLGVYCLLEAMPWGYGKGMALSSILHACKRAGLFKSREIEKIYSKYAKIFEDGMDKGVAGLDDIFYAVTATMTKTIPYSIRRFLVGNRTLFDEDGRAVSLTAAVVSLTSIPCLGHGALKFTETAQLSPRAPSEDINGVKTLITEAVATREWTKYPQMAVILMGFLASMNNATEKNDPTLTSSSSWNEISVMMDSKLPTALPGTVLEAVMRALSQQFHEPSLDADETATNLLVNLLKCLEVLSLPGHFATFLDELFRCNDETKSACTKLLISQIRGRPRAVFDGREYIDLALKMTKMPATSIKTLLGQGEAPFIFIEALVDLVPKFSTDSAGEVVENFWRLCFNKVGDLPGMSVAFLKALKTLLKGEGNKKTLMISPKTLNFLRNFLVTRVFAGIRDAPWTVTSASLTIEERSIVESYAGCLQEIPVSALVDAEFFTLKELDGFIGEALRYRCVMTLVKNGYFTNPTRASSEITSAIAWFSRQLTSAEEEIFTVTLLQVACSIADATSGENSDRRKELLLTLLDNLLLTGPSASFVGLQMLGALLCRWVGGCGSDGDLSLACLISVQMERWKELTPPTLQQIFRIMVHDLPFNLSSYARREKLSGVIFNRLWRVYNKWFELGAEQETMDCVRRALICCRGVDAASDEFTSLAISILT